MRFDLLYRVYLSLSVCVGESHVVLERCGWVNEDRVFNSSMQCSFPSNHLLEVLSLSWHERSVFHHDRVLRWQPMTLGDDGWYKRKNQHCYHSRCDFLRVILNRFLVHFTNSWTFFNQAVRRIPGNFWFSSASVRLDLSCGFSGISTSLYRVCSSMPTQLNAFCHIST